MPWARVHCNRLPDNIVLVGIKQILAFSASMLVRMINNFESFCTDGKSKISTCILYVYTVCMCFLHVFLTVIQGTHTLLLDSNLQGGSLLTQHREEIG